MTEPQSIIPTRVLKLLCDTQNSNSVGIKFLDDSDIKQIGIALSNPIDLDEWAVVPKEPSLKMEHCGDNELPKQNRGFATSCEVYQIMLEASPPHPALKGGDDG